MATSESRESQVARGFWRWECPKHGANYGTPTESTSSYGKRWYQHCRLPASVLVRVEYVPREDAEALADALAVMVASWPLASAVEALAAYRLAHPPGPEPEGTK